MSTFLVFSARSSSFSSCQRCIRAVGSLQEAKETGDTFLHEDRGREALTAPRFAIVGCVLFHYATVQEGGNVETSCDSPQGGGAPTAMASPGVQCSSAPPRFTPREAAHQVLEGRAH